MSVSLMKKATAHAVAAIAFLALAGTAGAADQVKIGALECTVAPGVGLIVVSSRAVDCVFRPDRGPLERYRGEVTRVGLDIGFTGQGALAWAVFAPTSTPTSGGLAGNYVGISGQASFGVGLGANALVGGSNRTFALQPISVEAQTGLNLAVGVAGLTLR